MRFLVKEYNKAIEAHAEHHKHEFGFVELVEQNELWPVPKTIKSQDDFEEMAKEMASDSHINRIRKYTHRI